MANTTTIAMHDTTLIDVAETGAATTMPMDEETFRAFYDRTARALWADERTRGIPVVLLTAKVQVLETWREVPGVVGALSKPFDPFGLVTQVDRILGAGDNENVLTT